MDPKELELVSNLVLENIRLQARCANLTRAVCSLMEMVRPEDWSMSAVGEGPVRPGGPDGEAVRVDDPEVKPDATVEGKP